MQKKNIPILISRISMPQFFNRIVVLFSTTGERLQSGEEDLAAAVNAAPQELDDDED